MAGKWAFVDECKAKDYILVAVIIEQADAAEIRKVLNGLRMKGQRRIHFASESDSRRRKILSTLNGLKIEAAYVRVATKQEKLARQEAWHSLTPRLLRLGVTSLVIERDETNETLDKATLTKMLKEETSGDTFSYTHQNPQNEEMLWIADAYAWALNRGSPWVARMKLKN